ncbi:hypothetical protein [Cupriavidus sp. DL-D2]|uniref:nSTAND3 domain-containing NTPase n=1 Tax=Cupriavidus sp. DL-D2 TaxID=3144974 RepID=UPI003214DA50
MNTQDDDSARWPLLGDPRRQAVAALGGYDYQIWRSVEAWLRLSEGDTLFLECAEDYDVINATSAQAVQIKRSAEDISLGSADVRTAIVQFWKLCERNPGRRPSLRFLTRGGIRAEQSKFFGKEKGIDVWRKAAAGDDVAASSIGRYLASYESPPTLDKFLREANPSELRERLIAPIDWVTEEEDSEAVRLAVRRMTIEMGRLAGISASISVSAVDGFLARCWEAACQPTAQLRSLTCEDRQLTFESKTSLVIPAASGLLAQMGDALLAQAFPQGGSGRLTFLPTPLDLGQPPLPDFPLERSAVIDRVLSALSKTRAVLIVGSEGRGKTTVANLTARRINAPARWIDFSGIDDQALLPTVESVLVRLRSAGNRQVIVLDDFPVSEGLTDANWTRLRLIIEECHARHHELIITAKGVHIEAVDPRVRLAKIELVDVPDLSLEEIYEFLRALGCNETEAQRWAKCTLIQTGGGHPKLVYLRGLELREEGWPSSTIDSWITPPHSIDEARTVARQTASRTLQIEARELLYSLSLTSLPFRRDVALHVGSKIDGLSAPGDVLDQLIGRWVESQGKSSFRVTPLLSGQAKLAWPERKVEEVHGHLFDAFIQRKNIQVNEAFQILMHAWQSKDQARLGNMLTSLIMEDGDAKNAVYEDLAPLLLMGSSGTDPAVPFSATCSILLRTLQFKVAQQEKPDLLEKVACRWSEEIERLPHGQLRESSQFIRAFVVSAATGGNLSAATIIHAIEDLVRNESRFPELIDGMSRLRHLPGQPDLGDDLVPVLFGFMYSRCETIEYQDAILTALSACSSHSRERMLKAFSIPFFANHSLLIDRAWVAESKRPSPRWDYACAILSRAIELASAWKCDALLIASTRPLSIIYEEYLGLQDRSIECLRQAAEIVGTHPDLQEQEANVLFHRKQYDDALKLWELCLRPDGRFADLNYRDPFAFRKAAISAGSLGLYEKASEWFAEAAASASTMKMEATAAGALFDASFCAFKARSWHKSIALAWAALEALQNEYDPSDQFAHFATKKLGGQILLWMMGQVRDDYRSLPTPEPVLGQCSNPGKDASIAELPANPYELSAVMLMEIASRIRVSNPDLDAERERIALSRSPTVAFQFWSLKCHECIIENEPRELAVNLIGLQRSRWLGAAQARVGGNALYRCEETPNEADREARIGGGAAFLLVLFILASTDQTGQAVMSAWRTTLDTSEDADLLKKELDSVSEYFLVDADTALMTFRDKGTASIAKLCAAARLLLEQRRSFAQTSLWLTALLTWLWQSDAQLILSGSLNSLADIAAKLCRPHLDTPALFNVPRISVPLLRRAVEIETEGGAQRLLKIMEAVEIASGIALPAVLRQGLGDAASIEKACAVGDGQ